MKILDGLSLLSTIIALIAYFGFDKEIFSYGVVLVFLFLSEVFLLVEKSD